MKEYMNNIASNESLRKRICSDILSGRLHHTYIIEGIPGSGRHLFARSIAKALVCENKNIDGIPLPCHECSNCLKIDKDISPDVITVKKEDDRSTIGVEAARFIKNDICIYPNDFDYKIYIIEDADIMTPQAQNALLLTLEEPPAYAIILLLCEKAETLLETVRSRAPILRTESIPFDIMADYLCNIAPEKYSLEARKLKKSSEPEFLEIVASSNGSVGKAYELLDLEKRAPLLELRREVRQLIETVISAGSKTDIFDSVSSLSQKRDELASQLELVTLAIRDLIVLKKSETAPLCFYSDREYAIECSAMKSAMFLFKFKASCEEAISSLDKNANVKLTLTALAVNISTK